MDIREALRRILRIGGTALSVLAMSLVCWAWLSANGDLPGAEGARGVMCVSLGLLVLDVACGVAVLAVAELQRAP